MNKDLRPSFLAVLFAVATGAAHAQSTAADEAAIRDARRTQTQALARDDLDNVVKYRTPDITIRRALGHPVEGASAARVLPEPTGSANPATCVIYQREAASVSASSNWPPACEEGRWSGHPASVDAKPMLSGRYSAQWVKRNGSWFIRSELFVAIDGAAAGCSAVALA